VKSTVEALEGNKVKLSVDVDESEFERAIDVAFRKLAHEVRIPGFRPGKAPRRVLEARFGSGIARAEALRDALPDYYVEAVKEHDVDVIAPPEIDITQGQDAGDISFDAVVEIRPTITVAGYGDLTVTISRPEPSDDEIDARVDDFRGKFGELAPVDRPAVDADHVTIDIGGSLDGEPLPGLTAEDYLYEVGSGNILPEVDEQLRGAKAGDILEFDADHPDPDEEGRLHFRLLVKSIQERVLPELTDEWVGENTEFDSVAAYRDDVRTRMATLKKAQAQMELRSKVGEALAALVTDDIPEAMVASEMENQLQNMVLRMNAQGISIDQYLQITGRSVDDLRAELREGAEPAVRLDLALRAVAEAEGLEATDEDYDDEVARVAERARLDPAEVRDRFERAGQVSAVRSDIRKQKAFDWLSERVSVVDDEGTPIDREALELDAPGAEAVDGDEDDEDDEAGSETGRGAADPAAEGADEGTSGATPAAADQIDEDEDE
jgi:trigger factor